MTTLCKYISKIVKIYWKLRGFKYIVNMDTKEIHDLDEITSRCHVYDINDSVLIKKSEFSMWMASGYNGCAWCLNTYDKKNDIRK